MRRTTLLLVAMGALLMIGAGVALAATVSGSFTGTKQADTIKGDKNGSTADKLTGGGSGDDIKGFNNDDELYGDNGGDTLKGGDDNDLLDGGSGNDDLQGNTGADFINAADDEADSVISCGGSDPGGDGSADTVVLDQTLDTAGGDCDLTEGDTVTPVP